ncbi:MAG: fibrillarin-like rRNA/tRNA 2'-O-methyltransferase, partial [Candidatus Nanoarchaeia archaeon]|nr:fibrillarin-like rRNA/tRNA 2'-O-methyltransferase [Candidatus Haiyanarchaeum thermophilum]
MRVEKSKVNANVFFLKNGGKILATKNLVKGFRFSDERLFTIGDVEYREWIPNRSKIAAAILNGLKVLPIQKGSRVLYLGAAAGQTASYCSDIVGKDGVVYCVEISDRVLREL